MAQLSGAVYEYLAKLYDGVVAPRESIVNVATTRTNIVGNNPDRVELVLVNIGAESTFVYTTSQNLASGAGIRLGPAGGQMAVNIVHDSILPTMNWFGRSTVAANDIFVLEVIREARVRS